MKRNRLLKKIVAFTLTLSCLLLLYLQSSSQTSFPSALDTQPIINNIKHHQIPQKHLDRYHPNLHQIKAESDQFDVTVPRDYVLESIRRIRMPQAEPVNDDTPAEKQQQQQQKQRQSVLHKSNFNNDNNNNNSNNKHAEKKQDSVYTMASDDEFLPPGDGTDPSEKYLTYLPHSGFHNQRISVINALLLAHRLNRTLLMPPVMLGEAIHWRKYESLDSYHRRLTKANLEYCQDYLDIYYDPGKKEQAASIIPPKCRSSFNYTSLRWDRLFDLTALKQRVRIRYRDDYDKTYLQRTYGIDPQDVYHIRDELLYDYRISDQSGESLGKYKREIFLYDLAERPERLLSFGSLFGSGRVMHSTPESIELYNFLFKQFVFKPQALPELFAEATDIITRLGGPRSYVSFHARVGDSIFERFSSQVMGKLWSDLQKYTPLVSPPPSFILEKNEVNTDLCLAPLETPDTDAIDWTTGQVAPGRPLLMFMATDAKHPRQFPLFEQLYKTFPCVVTLSDLYDYKDSALATLVNPADGIRYGKFLVPFLDGLIASYAQEFTGSMWSTFSSYIRFLHEQYVGMQ